MAFTQFPATLAVRTIDSNESFSLGKFTMSENLELNSVRVSLYKHGIAGGSETLKLDLYSGLEAESPGIYVSSNTISLSDVTTENYFLFDLRFDFSLTNLTSGLSYFFKLTTANYTRNADTYYLAGVKDGPYQIYTGNSTGYENNTIKFLLFGLK